MKLYDYQERAIKELSQAWHSGYRRPCIVIPCGGGKSVIASEIAKRTTDNKREVMFIVHRQELCEQIENTFTSYGVDMDYCSVNMVQTVSHHLTDNNPTLIITDENHHCLAATYKKIYTAYVTLYINFVKDAVFDNVTIYPQLEFGDTATDYEPYNGTIYSITPDANPYKVTTDVRQVEGFNNVWIADDSNPVLTIDYSTVNPTTKMLMDRIDELALALIAAESE